MLTPQEQALFRFAERIYRQYFSSFYSGPSGFHEFLTFPENSTLEIKLLWLGNILVSIFELLPRCSNFSHQLKLDLHRLSDLMNGYDGTIESMRVLPNFEFCKKILQNQIIPDLLDLPFR